MDLTVIQTMTTAKTRMTEDAFLLAGRELAQAKSCAREAFQQDSAPRVRKIIDKLKREDALSEQLTSSRY